MVSRGNVNLLAKENQTTKKIGKYCNLVQTKFKLKDKNKGKNFEQNSKSILQER